MVIKAYYFKNHLIQPEFNGWAVNGCLFETKQQAHNYVNQLILKRYIKEEKPNAKA